MRRVIIVGATGFFGRALAEELLRSGIDVLRASRSGSLDLMLDPENRSSLRSVLQREDLIVDAAGPYQERSTKLLEAAIETGCDLVDLADGLEFVESVIAHRSEIDAAGIRVITACSSVSAISAAAVRWAGFQSPRRVTGFLAPASRKTSSIGTARSLLKSIGRPIRTLENGALVTKVGWSESRRSTLLAATPQLSGYLFETPDPLFLPGIWPSLQTIDFYVDTQVFGLNGVLRMLAAVPKLIPAVERMLPLLLKGTRPLGSRAGRLAFEVEGAAGQTAWVTFAAERYSHLIAVAPAVLATKALLKKEIPEAGLVRVDRYFKLDQLRSYLEGRGVNCLFGRTGAD